MHDTVIISVRGCHMDNLPADLVALGIKFLRINYPSLSITLCYENDPEGGSLENYKQYWVKKIDSGVSRFENQRCSIREQCYDAAQLRLTCAALDHKVNFISTDLPGMDKIPQGDPRAAALRSERESNMAAKIKHAAHQYGGIIFDFGGFNHSSRIQRLLEAYANTETGDSENAAFKKHVKLLRFYCVYSAECQHEFTLKVRAMQFAKVKLSAYPYGLKFITTSQLNPDPSSLLMDKPESAKGVNELRLKKEAQIEAENLFIEELQSFAQRLVKTTQDEENKKIKQDTTDFLPLSTLKHSIETPLTKGTLSNTRPKAKSRGFCSLI